MDDWDIPDEEDYETQYADELEMLDELDNDGPPARKSLKFHGNGTEENRAYINSNHNFNNVLEDLTKSKKRDRNETFSTLTDDVKEDVDDIDWLTSGDSVTGPCRKKARIVSVRNGELDSIESQLPQPLNTVSDNKKWNSPSSGKVERRKVFRCLPMSCEAVAVTRMDGQRLYLSLKADADAEEKRCSMRRNGPGHSLQLLSIPFSLLRDHVEEERHRRTIEESERLTASLHRMLNEGSNPEEDEAQKTDISEDEPLVPQSALWVEKYSPRLFTELLSDDAINRTLLKWLKLWDRVVFNRGKNEKVKTKPTQHKKHKQTHNRKQGIQDTADWDELDASGRPTRKVALLCGPPGLGKTTLAHVIATHAGYNVVEMNASDDRSAEVFKNTLEASTQMKSVLGYNEKPNCLIIDEIDGAPAPAINVLMSAIKQKDSDAALSKKSNKGKKVGPLSRPIICICNDQYAPALRQLRQVAFLVKFPPTVSGRLASRLLEIARQESVNTDLTTLSSLCEKTDNDIRSCLNTLQFIHKRHGRVWLEHVQSLDIGQKDAHRSLFSIWQEIFQLPKPKRHRFAAVANSGSQVGIADNRGLLSIGALGGNPTSGEHRGMSAVSSRFHSVLHSAMSSGQYDKVSQGLFENYLQVKLKDSSFEVVVSATEWLTFSDFVDRAVNERQSYMLLGYSPFLSVAFHLLFASSSHSKLSYPSSQYESHFKETKTRNLVNTIKNESSPRMRQNVDTHTACLELFPFILEVITPTLRPVNTQLFSTREKQQLVELIDSMIAYNLTYHQERNFDGQYTYMLDPNIEEAVKFPGLPQHKQLTYANKQLIAREIELEKTRRAERALISQSHTDGKQEENKPKKSVVVISLDTKKTTPKASKPALDFFGRPLKDKPKPQDCQAEHLSQSKPSIIWFRFNEGYSNAVRKSVKVQEFL